MQNRKQSLEARTQNLGVQEKQLVLLSPNTNPHLISCNFHLFILLKKLFKFAVELLI